MISMVMYDIVLDNGDKVTVIAKNIREALALAEVYGDTAIECKFVRRIEKLLIEGELFSI